MGKDRDDTKRVSITRPDKKGDRLRATLTFLSGDATGRLVDLERVLVIGRGDEADLRLEDESLSRRHVRFALMHGTWFIEDLESTNGTFVNSERLEDVVQVADGARIQLGDDTLLRFSLHDEREYEAQRKLFESSVKDALTGCFNRHYLEASLPAEISYAKRHQTGLSVLFADCDHFKSINDTHGHLVGDEVLRRVGDFLRRAVRAEDIVVRYGGEEFVLLVRNTPAPAVGTLAERLRAGVEALKIQNGDVSVSVTVTLGVAHLAPADDASTFLARADGALYRGKRSGRNRVVVA
jgi:diguanylate cyclase (GGDEF)-like protein